MRRELFVVVCDGGDLLKGLAAGKPIFGTVSFEPDPEHPFGQWSAALMKVDVEGVPGRGLFRLSFMSEEVPADALNRSTPMEFFRAPNLIATLNRAFHQHQRGLVDHDFVLMPRVPARDVSEVAAA